jgi:hypothetical protein
MFTLFDVHLYAPSLLVLPGKRHARDMQGGDLSEANSPAT